MAIKEGAKKTVLFGIIIAMLVIIVVVFFVMALKNPNISTNVDTSDILKITNEGSFDLTGSYRGIRINTKGEVLLNLKDVEITSSGIPAIYIENADKVSIVASGENKITATTTTDLDGAIYSKDKLEFLGDGSIEINSNFDGIVSKDVITIKNGTYNINADSTGIKGKDGVSVDNATLKIKSGGDGIKTTNDEDKTAGSIEIKAGKFDIECVNDGISAINQLLIQDGHFSIKTENESSKESSKGLKAGSLIEISNGMYGIQSTDDAIHSKGNVILNNGTYVIKTDNDGIYADGLNEINEGTYVITASKGIRATYAKLNNGMITIDAKDDGINASDKSEDYKPMVEINDGYVSIKMEQDNGNGISSNGEIYINGGIVDINAKSPFKYDGKAWHNGGEITVNGERVGEIAKE